MLVCGWVRTKRESRHCTFIELSDGSCQKTLQLVADPDCAAYAGLKQLLTGCALKAWGTLKESPAKGQSRELHLEGFEVLGLSDQSYPLQKKGHSLEFLREIAHLRPRTNTFGAVFRVRDAIAQEVHRFFRQRGFLWAHTPILTASDCEGAGELFRVSTHRDPSHAQASSAEETQSEFFGRAAHLTVSGQLEAECMAMSLGQVYTFGPTFRAENSNTSRHLAEFWMVEPEVAFADLPEIMTLAEDFIRALVAAVLKECPDELAFFEKMYRNIRISELETLASETFARISYTDAIALLKDGAKKTRFEFQPEWGADLQTEHERFLSETVFGKPVIVHDYPKDIKAFYMRLNDDMRTVAAMDVLVPGLGELIGGSQREERLGHLEARMKEMEIPTQDLQWYLDLRRFGTAPHAGFGMGFERMVMYLTGMQNIRDSILCPRTPKSIHF